MCLFSFASLPLCLKAQRLHSSYSAKPGLLQVGHRKFQERTHLRLETKAAKKCGRRNNQSHETGTSCKKSLHSSGSTAKRRRRQTFMSRCFPIQRLSAWHGMGKRG